MQNPEYFVVDKKHVYIVIVLSALVIFLNLHRGDLLGYDDAFYAHEGKYILQYGDWWTIHLNGWLNFEYPPLYIWMEAVSLKLFGINDVAARLPTAILGLLTIVLVYFLTLELTRNVLTSLCAAWILMLTPYFMGYSMRAMTDVPFTFFLVCALFFYIKGLNNPKCFYLCGIAIAAGLMTRTVIGFIPLGIIGLHLILTMRFRVLFSMHFIFGMLVGLALPLAWYIPQYNKFGDLFLREHFKFIRNKISTPNERKHENGYWWSILIYAFRYPVLIIKGYWPPLPLFVIGLISQLKTVIKYRESNAIFLTLWIGLIIIPFSFAEAKVLRYIMAVFPAFAIIAAYPASKYVARLMEKKYFKKLYIGVIAFVILMATIGLPTKKPTGMREFAEQVEAKTTPSDKIFFYGDHQFLNQFIWYQNRVCQQHIKIPNDLKEAMTANKGGVFVMNKDDYNMLVAHTGVNVTELVEYATFISFRLNNGM